MIRRAKRYPSPLARTAKEFGQTELTNLETIQPFYVPPWRGGIQGTMDNREEAIRIANAHEPGEIRWFTDASGNNSRIGAAAVGRVGTRDYMEAMTLGTQENLSVHYAEPAAIFMALRLVVNIISITRRSLSNGFVNVVWTDCKSAIESVHRPYQRSGRHVHDSPCLLKGKLKPKDSYLTRSSPWYPINAKTMPLLQSQNPEGLTFFEYGAIVIKSRETRTWRWLKCESAGGKRNSKSRRLRTHPTSWLICQYLRTSCCRSTIHLFYLLGHPLTFAALISYCPYSATSQDDVMFALMMLPFVVETAGSAWWKHSFVTMPEFDIAIQVWGGLSMSWEDWMYVEVPYKSASGLYVDIWLAWISSSLNVLQVSFYVASTPIIVNLWGLLYRV